MASGLPSMLSGIVMLMVPLMGRSTLDVKHYAVWALLATLMNAGVTFDLGGSSFVLAHGYGAASRRAVLGAAGASALAGLFLCAIAATVWEEFTRAYVDPAATWPSFWMSVAVVMVRSASTVLAAAMQSARSFRLRATLLVSPALLQVVLCWVLLKQGQGIQSLPMSALISNGGAFVIAAVWFALRFRTPAAHTTLKLWAYAKVRLVATACGLTLTQFDRWAFTRVGSAQWLADYDVAMRLAVLPKSVAIAFVPGLVVEAASHRALRQAIGDRALRLTAALCVLGGVGLFVVIGLAAAFQAVSASSQFLALLAICIVWNSLNTTTAPLTAMYAGMGHPKVELNYLVPTTVGACLSWVIGALAGSVWVAFGGMALSLTAGSVWFVLRYRDFSRQPDMGSPEQEGAL